MNRREKEQEVETLRQSLKGINSAFLFGYRGLTVNQVSDLRARMRRSASTYKVLKNRLAVRAIESTELEALKSHMVGPTAIAFNPGEPVALAKALTEFAKENPALEFRVGLLDGRPVGAAEFQSLASLPSREVLLARFLGALTSPLASFQRAILSPMRDLAVVLGQVAKKKQAG